MYFAAQAEAEAAAGAEAGAGAAAYNSTIEQMLAPLPLPLPVPVRSACSAVSTSSMRTLLTPTNTLRKACVDWEIGLRPVAAAAPEATRAVMSRPLYPPLPPPPLLLLLLLLKTKPAAAHVGDVHAEHRAHLPSLLLLLLLLILLLLNALLLAAQALLPRAGADALAGASADVDVDAGCAPRFALFADGISLSLLLFRLLILLLLPVLLQLLGCPSLASP